MSTTGTQDLQELIQGLLSSEMSPWGSYQNLQLLSDSLQQTPNSGLTLDLIRCHSKLSRCIRDSNPSDNLDHEASLVEDTARRIKKSYGSLADFIPQKPDAALRLTNVESYVSHAYLRDFVGGFALPIEQQGKRKPVVSIALPNGPLLAAVCIAVTSHYIAAPVNPAAGPQQFQADVLQAGARCILTTREDYTKLQLEGGWTQDNDILVVLVDLGNDMRISLTIPDGTPIASDKAAEPNAADDIALILFTSGTSGTKKVVPLTTHSIVAGVAFVIDSWAMTESDVCLNMMPLYHVGGLIRNIFAPIFSGGSTICCPAFDPNCFWDMVETTLPTWYYASPSMHSVILAESKHRPEALSQNRIRLVCNAAGGLLPSLATQLRDTFDCVVLPSYGMTECMPISTPPVNYRLDRPGTSGISTGPDLAILNFDFRALPSGTVGRICVRGEPLFPGYLRPDGTIDRSAMSEDGWFDTGDMGYMDNDGYLYITGRSKEVINRGGELISPFEVENAIVAASNQPDSPIHGRVSQALAFSAQHDVLQEVVGVILVCPQGVPRPDLKLLHSSLKSSLQQLKWPVLIVYMDDLPKNNNKILRIKLAERLALPQITDETSYLSRHWEGVCPRPDTPLSAPIECSPCNVDLNIISSQISSIMPDGSSFCIRMSPEERTIRAILAPSGPDLPPLDDQLSGYIKEKLVSMVHGYMMPQKMQILQVPLPTDDHGNVDDVALQRILAEIESSAASGDDTWSMEGRVTKAFASVLNVSSADIPSDGDFFDLGGDSLKAGRLLSVLRAEFSIHIPIDAIFHYGSPSTLAAYIRERLPPDWEQSSGSGPKEEAFFAEGCEKTYSSTRWWLMALQLVPMCILYPLRRAFQWTVFMVFLASTQHWLTAQYVPGRLLNLTVSILVARLVTNAVMPWFGIAAKWLFIGKFKEGVYPMWGPYHTRWWMVQKTVDICGQGLFKQTDFTSVLYLRLMGAKIGKGVKIKGAQMGEWDLLEIEDGAVLERCIVRPFAGERNTSMYLGKVRIGRNATVGLSSIVAPGTTVPDNACIGPNSSSWEVDDADEANRDLLSSNIPGAHWALEWLITQPLVVIAWIVSLLPWFAGLIGLVMSEPVGTETPLYSILMWFAATHRVGYHYLALVLRVSVSPFILFGITIVVKYILDAIFGKMQPGPVQGRSQIQAWRMGLMKSLYPVKSMHSMTELLGHHYEGTSIAVRMLGGRVGRRVYWPGTGPSISDYHLLDIGNDVVFGSRAHLVTSDGTGSELIKVKDRAMIADRVTLLPGVTIGEKTIMGSGALTSRNEYYNDGGTYVGSKKGDAVCLNAGAATLPEKNASAEYHSSSEIAIIEENTDVESNSKEKSRVSTTKIRPQSNNNDDDLKPEDTSPFGRAFYLKQAPYRVYGMGMIIFYSAALTVFTAFYWNVPSISSIQVVAVLFRNNQEQLGKEHLLARAIWPDTGVLYSLFFLCVSVMTTAQAILATAAVIGAKWALLGRRAAGNYDWDKSPYCQNWQLYLTVEKLRRYCYRGHGILGMLTGTHWLVLYFRALGGNIGDNCALFANGQPSLMFTEPDLITIGSRTVIDDASVVAHINTRGKFDLNRLEIGERCVMRSGSRLLSGAVMKDDSALLEHTLIMGGDVVEKGWTMQGWPAERFKGRRVKLADTIDGWRGNGDESSTAATSRMDLSSEDGGKKA